MTDTPRFGHAPIMMRRLPDNHEGRIMPGDFYWLHENGLRLLCVALPIQNATRGLLSEWTIDHKNGCGAQWSWDGNEDKPTLSPSLHAVGWWHGWVRDGQLVEA